MSTNTMPNSFDHDDLLLSLQTFMRNTEAFKDVNWDGSAAKALLRVLAFNTQLQQTSNSFLFNELNLDTSQIKRNVDSMATSLGYLPKGKRAAVYKADIIVTPQPSQPKPDRIVLDRKTKFFSARDGIALNFVTGTEYEAQLVGGKYVFEGVELVQGTWAHNSFLVQSDYSVESFVIPNSNIDTDHMRVGVLESSHSSKLDAYKRFETIYDLGADSKTYFLTINKDGLYRVEFGDDRLSKRLTYGNVVVVESLVTDGDIGNNAVDIACIGSVAGFYNVEVAPYQKYSYGGTNEESIDSVRRAASLSFSAQGSAVSSSDYVAITKQIFSEAGSVVSWGGEENDPPLYGYQMISVKPRNTDTLNDVQKANLVVLISKRCVGSITPVIVDPDFTYLNFDINVLYTMGKSILSEQSLKVKLAKAIREFSESSLEFFGSDFIYSKMVSFINSVDNSFIGNVTKVTYAKKFIPVLNVFGNYTLDFGAAIQPGSFVASGFTVLDTVTGWTYSMIDNAGLIYVKRVSPDTIPVSYVFPSSVGTIDYTTGIVRLSKFKPISLLEDYGVDVTVAPVSVDPSLYSSRSSIIKVDKLLINMTSRESKKD